MTARTMGNIITVAGWLNIIMGIVRLAQYEGFLALLHVSVGVFALWIRSNRRHLEGQ